MKLKIRNNDGELAANDSHCLCCGLSEKTIEFLKVSNVDIFIPSIEIGPPSCGLIHICSNCKEAILDGIWSEKIVLPDHNMFGTNLHRYVKKFVDKHKLELIDIAMDYQYLEHVIKDFHEHIVKLKKDAFKSKSWSLPTTKDIYTWMVKCNNGDIKLGAYSDSDKMSRKTLIDASYTMIDDTNIDMLGDMLDHDFISTIVSRKDICIVNLTATAQLMYEYKVSFDFNVLAINERVSQKVKNTSKSTSNKTSGSSKNKGKDSSDLDDILPGTGLVIE